VRIDARGSGPPLEPKPLVARARPEGGGGLVTIATPHPKLLRIGPTTTRHTQPPTHAVLSRRGGGQEGERRGVVVSVGA
jgi:hypothetical protein